MLSVRAHLINGVLRAARLRGVDRAIAAAAHDPSVEASIIRRARRMNRLEPPRRVARHRPHQRIDVGATPLHVLSHADTPGDRVMLYLHGGGYFTGPMGSHWKTMIGLTDELGCDLALPIYPKAPEHQSRDVIASTTDVYDLMLERYGAENVVVGGDSAGGGLAVSLLLAAREAGRSQPLAALLISPWLDLTMADPAAGALSDRDLMLTVEGARLAGDWYAGDLDPADPRISPLNADTSGIAPIHIWVGTNEIFLPDCRTFVGKARADGHRATIHEMDEGQHVAAMWPTPEGRCARAQMVALVDWP